MTILRDRDCDEGKTVVDVFLDHLTDFSYPATGPVEEEAHVIIFHNLKGFDGVFLLKALYQDSRKVENQACMGAKVLTFKTGSITFKDSLCFLSYPLSAFPSTFGLTEAKKGYFPHKFNTPGNQSYVGSIPAMQYYDPEGMKPHEKAAFETWYRKNGKNCLTSIN